MTTPGAVLHTMTEAEIARVVELERLRCVGVVLAEVGRRRLAGEYALAAVLDDLATRLEHPELER